ncbi:Aldo/keto reductase [Mycena olivaceomarginata]|nr:Aldo/keto reductase [Mycena olivaceomarginata]
MEYVRLGQSGLKISKIILGCMSYGNPKWWGNWVLGKRKRRNTSRLREFLNPSQEVLFNCLGIPSYDAGVNAFDTANVYSSGISEEILGRAIKQHQLPPRRNCGYDKSMLPSLSRQDVVYGLSRKHIFDSVKHSLERLQLDYIDLLQPPLRSQHPIEETARGYVRYIGMSSCYAWQYYAIANKLTRSFHANHYNLLYREEEREMFPTLKHFGVGAIPWSPLARGSAHPTAGEQNETKRAESDGMPPSVVEEIAKQRGISMAQVSIAWALSKEGVSAPIVGSTSLANLADAIGNCGRHIKLTEEEIKSLEEPYLPMPFWGIGEWNEDCISCR